jgi:rhodanese-related sulfurtransferase
MTAAVDRLLDQARARLRRLDPPEAAAVVAGGGLLVDIHPAAQRQEEGEVPGALVVERNVLEWRLDPTSPHRLAQVRGRDQPVVILCSEGYTSSWPRPPSSSWACTGPPTWSVATTPGRGPGCPVHRPGRHR